MDSVHKNRSPANRRAPERRRRDIKLGPNPGRPLCAEASPPCRGDEASPPRRRTVFQSRLRATARSRGQAVVAGRGDAHGANRHALRPSRTFDTSGIGEPAWGFLHAVSLKGRKKSLENPSRDRRGVAGGSSQGVPHPGRSAPSVPRRSRGHTASIPVEECRPRQRETSISRKPAQFAVLMQTSQTSQFA
jgi:hypothetical protein